MKRAGRAVIFELKDMVGDPSCSAQMPDGRYARAVPEPFFDGLLARIRSAWEVVCGRAYPVAWPEPGELERAYRATLRAPPRTAKPALQGASTDWKI